MSNEEKIEKLQHEQNQDQYMERVTSKEPSEIVATAPGGIPSIRSGSTFADGVPFIDERFQENRKAQLEDSRTIEFRRMCPARSPEKMPGHGEWEAYLERKELLEDILTRAPKPRTQMGTLLRFLKVMEKENPLSVKQRERALEDRGILIRYLVKWARLELEGRLVEWADDIERREELRLSKALKKNRRNRERSITRRQLAVANVVKNRVADQRDAHELWANSSDWKAALQRANINLPDEGEVEVAPKKAPAVKKAPEVRKAVVRKKNPVAETSPSDAVEVTESIIDKLNRSFQ